MPTRKRTTKKQSPKRITKTAWPIVAWLSIPDVRAFDTAAKARGLSRSALLRDLALAALKRPTRKAR